jgi:uncharacterized protein
MTPLRIDVADLLHHPGARRPLRLVAPVSDLGGSAACVREPVVIDLVLERVSDGIVVRGTVQAHWEAECSLCLGDLGATLEVPVGELFEPAPVVGETYPIEGHEIDLELLVRDAVVLELPLAPTCESTGVGTCVPSMSAAYANAGDAEPDTDTPADPRWAALSELDL